MRSIISGISRWLYNPARAFDRVVRSKGGLFRSNNLAAHHQFLLDVATNTLDDLDNEPFASIRRSIHVNLVDNWDPNALAFADARWNHIGIYRGATTTVAAVMHAAMRSKAIWPEIPGDVSNVEAFLPLRRTLAKRRQYEEDVQGPDGVPAEILYKEPGNDMRLSLLSQMTASAWQFLIYHEFAHVARGHLDLAENEMGISMLLEATTSEPPPLDDAQLLQAMELDADRMAVQLLADQIRWNGDWSTGFASPDGWPPAVLLRVQLVAIGVLFEVFDWESTTLEQSKKQQHPHPAVRYKAVFQQVEELAIEFAVEPNELGTVFRMAVEDLGRIGEQLEWTLLRVINREANAIDEFYSQVATLFGRDELRLGTQALFRRIGVRLHHQIK